jgi:putative nucleotidyltransferase with HDIG domain
VKSQLQVEAVDILTADPVTGELVLTANRGFKNESLLRESLSRGYHYASTAMQNRRMVILRDIDREPTNFDTSKLFMSEEFKAYVAIPLFSKGKVKGVMEVYRRRPIELDQEWLEFLETLSGQAAIAIENVTLFTDLQHSNKELMQAYDTTIEGWSSALDMKDSETEGHTKRVAQMTVLLADALGMRADDLVHVRRGAMLHDIGKMGVPDQILRKPGPLNDDEWEIMRKHPEYAFEWLSPTRYLHPALDIPYCHHEKWDGTGYPQGLKGDEIPLKARTFSVVDVWDALSSDRPYRAKWPQKKVVRYIQEQSGTYFDPNIVPIFLDILQSQDVIQ